MSHNKLRDEIDKDKKDEKKDDKKEDKKEKTPEYTGEAQVVEVKPLTKERSLKEGEVPEELGNDFHYFVEPEYVRARYNPSDDSFLVIDANRAAKVVPAADFNAQYAPLSPNKQQTKFLSGLGGVEEVPPPPEQPAP